MTRWVILGTGTGVGKTYVTAQVARALVARGRKVTALKPIETGLVDREASDAALLERACGRRPAQHPLLDFPQPISPHLAARLAGVSIDVGAIRSWVDASAAETEAEIVVVESAGGALSPLSDARTNLDLARALEPAWLVLVAPDALGVLHDVRATWTALAALHRAPDALVLSRSRPADASTGTNAAELARLGLAPVAVFDGEPEASERVIEAFERAR